MQKAPHDAGPSALGLGHRSKKGLTAPLRYAAQLLRSRADVWRRQQLHTIDLPALRGLDHLIVKKMQTTLHVTKHHLLPQVVGHIAQFQKPHIGIVPDHWIALLDHHAKVVRVPEQALDIRAGILPGFLNIAIIEGRQLVADDPLNCIRILRKRRCGDDPKSEKH